jgi:hypothetical protein
VAFKQGLENIMYCKNCGTELPDNANYCMKCGKPQVADMAQLEETRWEKCEIEKEYITDTIAGAMGLGGNKVCFQAKAIGVDGFYIAGKSEIFKESHVSVPITKEIPILEALVAMLAKDGWEPMGTKGEFWYSYKFQRLVKPK